jgi:hypothetical protein
LNFHMRKRIKAVFLAAGALLALGLLVSPAHAQRGGLTARAGGHVGGPTSHSAARRSRDHRGRRGFYGSGFGDYYPFYDPYDDTDGGGEPVPARVIMQPAAPPAKAAESLVIELRGDHWVRLTSYGPRELGGQSNSQSAPGQPGSHVDAPSTSQDARSASAKATFEETQPPVELPPAVLVFRDGHQEEAAKYTIVGNTIFIKTDYWSSGSWTHQVPIAELDIPATLQANQARGAKFSLPSHSGEVMMRP